MPTSNYVIELRKKDRVETSTTSIGNQIKWYKDGYWLKADSLGYEGTAEEIASRLVGNSNMPSVEYNRCKIIEDGREYRGCFCENFLNKGEQFLNFNNIFNRTINNIDRLLVNKSVSDKIDIVAEIIQVNTGLQDIKTYIKRVLTIDAIILNEDRHFNNIGVIYNSCTNEFRYAPVFDNGMSLLSNVLEYTGIHGIERVKARPFSKSFSKQLNASWNCGLNINIQGLLMDLREYRNSNNRAYEVLLIQLRKYGYL